MLFQVEGTQIYLLASMHKLPKEYSEFPPAILKAYQQSEKCIFEENIFTPRYPYPPFTNEDGSKQYWVQSLEITGKISEECGYYLPFGFDHQLLELTIKDRKQLDFLDTENNCNGFAFAPKEEQLKMLELFTNHRDEIATFLRRLYTAWREWDIVTLTELLNSQFALFPETYKRLITSRNRIWIPKLIEIANSKTQTLVTVGAFHFLREDGLCQQTEKHGLNLLEIPINT